MRLAFISTILGYPWGSPDRIWTDLACRCLNRGDEVLIAVSPLTADCAEVRKLVDQGAVMLQRCEHTAFKGRSSEVLNRLPWRRSGTFIGKLEYFQPDLVVITQGGSVDMLAEPGLTSWLLRSAVPYGLLCHNSPKGTNVSKDQRQELIPVFAASRYTGFVSTQNLRMTEQILGTPVDRAALFQNPLGLTASDPLPWNQQESRPCLGLVGRLDIHHKGIDLLLTALSTLAGEFDFELRLTGRNETPDELTHCVRERKLQDHVNVMPPVEPARLSSVYGHLNLFVLSSRYEGCASSMVEALLCGRPVIATPVGGVDDWIESESNGYIVSDSSSDALCVGLRHALQQQASWPAMGQEAHRRAMAQRQNDPVDDLLQKLDRARRSE